MKSIPISPSPTIPKPVLAACKKLQDHGYKAWLAGGCVRDIIMTRPPRDWDVVTNAPLEKIREFFPDSLDVGAAFGIIKLIPQGPKDNPIHIDIAIFRKEGHYSDGRHPDAIEIGDEQSDVARRDFTVNAMYFDPTSNTVLDFVDGHKDIQAKILRTVGDPDTRFSEDALRIIRAVRFTAQLGFKIDKPTANAIRKCGSLLKKISRERVREEIFRLLESPKPVVGLEALLQNGLWEEVFGIKRVSLPADFRQLKINWKPTGLHWICGLAATGLFGDPINEPNELVDRLTEKIRLSNVEKRTLSQIVKVYKDSEIETPSTQALDWVKLARDDKALLDLSKAFVRRARGPSEKQKQDALDLIDQATRWAAKPDSEKSWPTAQDLIKSGIKEGPKLGTELKKQHWKVFWDKRPT